MRRAGFADAHLKALLLLDSSRCPVYTAPPCMRKLLNSKASRELNAVSTAKLTCDAFVHPPALSDLRSSENQGRFRRKQHCQLQQHLRSAVFDDVVVSLKPQLFQRLQRTTGIKKPLYWPLNLAEQVCIPAAAIRFLL